MVQTMTVLYSPYKKKSELNNMALEFNVDTRMVFIEVEQQLMEILTVRNLDQHRLQTCKVRS